MKFEILTIFPDFFRGPLDYGIVRKAREAGLIEILIHDLRNFTHDRHRTVDDRPFGGGEGMVLKPEPIFECLESLDVAARNERLKGGATESVVLLSPQGRLFNQTVAQEMMTRERVILICGRYEGVDERVSEHLADREISVGDFVSERWRTGRGDYRGYDDAAGSGSAGKRGFVAAGVVYDRRCGGETGRRAAKFDLRFGWIAGLSALHASGGFSRDAGSRSSDEWEP